MLNQARQEKRQAASSPPHQVHGDHWPESWHCSWTRQVHWGTLVRFWLPRRLVCDQQAQWDQPNGLDDPGEPCLQRHQRRTIWWEHGEVTLVCSCTLGLQAIWKIRLLKGRASSGCNSKNLLAFAASKYHCAGRSSDGCCCSVGSCTSQRIH